MSKVTEQDFGNFLSEFGYPRSKVSLKWLIQHEPTEEFVNWLCENVNSSNYLSDEELNEYKILEDSGQVLDGEELERAISEEIPEYFELSDIDSDYTSVLKDEVHYVQNHSEFMTTWLEEQESETSNLEREVVELEKMIAKQEKKLANAQSLGLGKSSSLESSLDTLINNLFNLKNYTLQRGQGLAEKCRFLMEIPINDFFENSDAFTHDFQMNLEQVTSSADMKNNCDGSSKGTFDQELKNATKGLQDTLLLRVHETARRKGQVSACEHLKDLLESRRLWELCSNCHVVVENLADKKLKLQRLKEQCNNEGLELKWWQKVKEVVSKYSKRKCAHIENLHNELNLYQKQTVCNKLRRLEEVLKMQCTTDLVWLLLLGEEVTEVLNLLELAKSGEAFLRGEHQNAQKRIESMTFIKERKKSEIHATETWNLVDTLLNYFRTSTEVLSHSNDLSVNPILLSSDVFHALKLLEQYYDKCETEKRKVEEMIKQLSSDMMSALKSSSKDLVKLKRICFGGSTDNYPVICSIKQILFFYQNDPLSKKNTKRIGKLKAQYQAEMKKSSVNRDERNLWKIFCTNPEQTQVFTNAVNLPTILINEESLVWGDI